jgi:hypothetical protein
LTVKYLSCAKDNDGHAVEICTNDEPVVYVERTDPEVVPGATMRCVIVAVTEVDISCCTSDGYKSVRFR